MPLIKATSRFEPDDSFLDGRSRQPAPEVTGADMLDTFRRDRNVVYPAWWENPAALAKRRIRELDFDRHVFIQHGDFACTVFRTMATSYAISIIPRRQEWKAGTGAQTAARRSG